MLVSLAWAKPPQAKHLNAPQPKQLKAPQPKQLKSLPPAAQLPKRSHATPRMFVWSSWRPLLEARVAAGRRGRRMCCRSTSPRLRAYVVWLPMLEGDSAEAARLEASLYQDKRISHYWDDGQLATELGGRLGLDRKAWDVICCLKSGVNGRRRPASSISRRRQLAPWLDSVKLRGKAEDLLQ